MIVVDSSALVAILCQETEAAHFAAVIAGAENCVMSALSLIEVSMVMAGSKGTATDWTGLDALVADLDIGVMVLDDRQVAAARNAFLRYGKGRSKAKLNMGDCASYALAKLRGWPLLFKGGDFIQTDLTADA